MKLDVAGVLRDAWAMAKRDVEVLVGVAGLFLFVPDLAQAMYVALPPDLPDFGDEAAADLWLKQIGIWSQHYELLVIVLGLLSLFGTLALFLLYADRARPTVAGALARGGALLPHYLLLALIVTVPVSIGAVLVFPGLYLKGRLMPVAPVFVAERPIGVFAAWHRSFALTRGNGLVLMGLAFVPLLGGRLIALPFALLGKALDGAPMANPVMAALLDAGMAGGHTIGTVAAVLIEIALYRRLSNGI
ncbi:MAG: hypothetical protein WCS75_06455 [Sphingomonas sp.]|jgi:hypothetical protein|uniref:hypothetical protein n=1 Tax=Sphingomonas sp. TaxID=28214 RepID=UPI00356733D6